MKKGRLTGRPSALSGYNTDVHSNLFGGHPAVVPIDHAPDAVLIAFT